MNHLVYKRSESSRNATIRFSGLVLLQIQFLCHYIHSAWQAPDSAFSATAISGLVFPYIKNDSNEFNTAKYRYFKFWKKTALVLDWELVSADSLSWCIGRDMVGLVHLYKIVKKCPSQFLNAFKLLVQQSKVWRYQFTNMETTKDSLWRS